MHTQETQQKFIELRAQGVSFALISEQLNVSKPTLIEWSHRHQHLVQNLRAIEWEAFVDTVLASCRERLRTLTEDLRKFEAEFARRDLASLSTASLHAIIESLRRRIEREVGTIIFTTPVDNLPRDAGGDEVQDWEP